MIFSLKLTMHLRRCQSGDGTVRPITVAGSKAAVDAKVRYRSPCRRQWAMMEEDLASEDRLQVRV
jgi:hypothetical protein